jgi:RNA polymerase sigma-70 factor (ECF subfamily)
MAAATLPEPLFNAARSGDPHAIARLLEIVQPDALRYARRACRTSADAEDAAQEALWLLFRRVGTIRSLAAFSGWLFTVVRRECLRLARRVGILERQATDDDLERAFAARPEAELRLDIAAALEALPSHYREILLLRDVKEMTIDEIAAATGDTRQAIKARLHRARLLMREYLGG